jgi:hypothetical protein
MRYRVLQGIKAFPLDKDNRALLNFISGWAAGEHAIYAGEMSGLPLAPAGSLTMRITMRSLAILFALLTSTAMAYAESSQFCSRESERLFAACADTTNSLYQQHRRWVLRDTNISGSDRSYENTRLNQERQRDLDSCRTTADAFRTNCLGD